MADTKIKAPITSTKNIFKWFAIILIVWIIPSTLLWSGIYLFIAEDCDRKDQNKFNIIENKLENIAYDSSRERFFQKKFSDLFSDLKNLSYKSSQNINYIINGFSGQYPKGMIDIYLFNGDLKLVKINNQFNPTFEKFINLATSDFDTSISENDIKEIGKDIPNPSLILNRVRGQKNRAIEIGNPDKYSLCYFNYDSNIGTQYIGGILVFVHYKNLTNKIILTETIPQDLKNNYGFIDNKSSRLPTTLNKTELNEDFLRGYYKQNPTNYFRRFSKLVYLKRLSEYCILVGAFDITHPNWTIYILAALVFIFVSVYFLKLTYYWFVINSRQKMNMRKRIIMLFLISYIVPVIVASIITSQYLMELKSSLFSNEEQSNYKRLSEIDSGFSRFITSRLIDYRNFNEELSKSANEPETIVNKLKSICDNYIADSVHLISSDSKILLSSAIVALEIRRQQNKTEQEKKEVFETWVDRNLLFTSTHNIHFEKKDEKLLYPNEDLQPDPHKTFLKVFANTAESAMDYYNQSKNISSSQKLKTSSLVIGAVIESQNFGLFQAAKTNITKFTSLEVMREKILAYLDIIPGPNGEAWYAYTVLNNLDNFERAYLSEIFNDIKNNRSRFNRILEEEDIRAISDYYFAPCFPTIKEYKTFEQSIRLSENNSKTFTHQMELNGEKCYVSVLRGSYLKDYLLLKIFKDKDIEKTYKKQINIAILLFIIIMIMGLALARLMTKFLIMPITDFINGVKAIAHNDYNYHIKVRSENEFGYISKAFNETSDKLEKLNIIQKTNEYFSIDKEIRCGSYMLYSAKDSSNIVISDYIDCMQLKQGTYALITANVSGNDVLSVHLIAMLKTAFITLMPIYPNNPEVVMSQLDKLFEPYKKTGHIVNCFIGILDPTNDNMVCTNAGQPYPIFYDKRQQDINFVNLPSTSLGFGSSEASHYRKHEFSLRYRTLVFYSHGASDLTNIDDEDSKNKEFLNIIRKSFKISRNPNKAEDILSRIKEYSDSFPWREDITIMTIQNRV